MSRKNETTSQIDDTVGQNIMDERLARGLSRQQLASAIDVTHQQLQKYEKGSNRVSAGRLWLIAKALKKPLEYFFEGNIKEEDNLHQRMSIEVSRNFLKIPSEKHRNAVNYMVKSLSDTL